MNRTLYVNLASLVTEGAEVPDPIAPQEIENDASNEFPLPQTNEVMEERKLDGIWNAERLLQTLLCFMDERGNIS